MRVRREPGWEMREGKRTREGRERVIILVDAEEISGSGILRVSIFESI